MIFDIFNEKSDYIVFQTHQGLGDQIVCSSIPHYISYNFPNKKILVVIRECHKSNMFRFFSKNEKIQLVSLENYPSHDKNYSFNNNELSLVDDWVKKNSYSLIRSGFEKYFYNSNLPWDFSFYDALGISYNVKYEFLSLDRNLDNEEKVCNKLTNLSLKDPLNKFAFIHDDPERGFEFNAKTNLKIVKNNKDHKIIDMIGFLQKADELHMMGSSIMCFAEIIGLPLSHQTAYYYTFRNDLNFFNKEKWKIIK